jgi:hypothetical protein
MVTTLDDPQTVQAWKLRVKSMFPADDNTKDIHATLMV